MQVRWTLLAALTVIAAPVAAQEASFSLTQEGAPAQAEVTAGETADVEVLLNITGENFSCNSEVIAPVNVTGEASLPEGAPANASVTPTNGTKEFPIPSGEYQTKSYTREANGTVSVATGSGVRENYTATLTVQAFFPGGTYSSCFPMDFSPAESSPSEVELSVVADNPPEEETEEEGDEDTGMNGTDGSPANTSTNASDDGSGEDDNGVPIPWHVAPLALGAAALAARRGR